MSFQFCILYCIWLRFVLYFVVFLCLVCPSFEAKSAGPFARVPYKPSCHGSTICNYKRTSWSIAYSVVVIVGSCIRLARAASFQGRIYCCPITTHVSLIARVHLRPISLCNRLFVAFCSFSFINWILFGSGSPVYQLPSLMRLRKTRSTHIRAPRSRPTGIN